MNDLNETSGKEIADEVNAWNRWAKEAGHDVFCFRVIGKNGQVDFFDGTFGGCISFIQDDLKVVVEKIKMGEEVDSPVVESFCRRKDADSTELDVKKLRYSLADVVSTANIILENLIECQ